MAKTLDLVPMIHNFLTLNQINREKNYLGTILMFI